MSRPSLAAALAIAWSLVASRPAPAQLVVGHDAADGAIWLVDVEGISPPRALVTGANAPTGALAADPRGTLYWIVGQQSLARAAFNQTGALSPVVVGSLLVSGTPAANFVAIAYDAQAERLYAYRNTNTLGSEGFYAIVARDATLVWSAPQPLLDLGGLDYDPVGDVFYALNDSLAALPTGRGLYRVRKPIAAPTIEFASPYATTDSDIDGLAIGDSKAFLVNDNALQGVQVYDFMRQEFLAPLPLPFTSTGTFAGATWAPQLVAANLVVELLVPPECSIAPGAEFEFTVTVRNIGPDAAKDAMLIVSLPAGAAFLSSIPPATPIGDELRLDLGHVFAGIQRLIRVRLRAPAPAGTLSFAASATTRTTDPVTTNNAAEASRTTGTPAPRSPSRARTILSTVRESTSSLLTDPLYAGTKYASAPGLGLGRPVVSPDGRTWAVIAFTDLPPASDSVILIGDANGVRVAVREGVTRLPPTTVPRSGAGTPFHPWPAINSEARIAFSCVDSAASQTACLWSSTGTTLVARQGDPVEALSPDVRFAGAPLAVAIDDAFGPLVVAQIAGEGVGPANNTIVLRPGVGLLARTGITIPIPQHQDAQNPFGSLPDGSAHPRALSVDAGGSRVLLTGTLQTTDPAHDEVLVLDGVVLVQEGVPLTNEPFSTPTRSPAPITSAALSPAGAWLAIGANQDDTIEDSDWVAINGAVVAARGQPITPCATERWLAGTERQSFDAAAINPRGDVVIAGGTDAPDTPGVAGATLLVLNSSRVLARRGEALDLDGNGLLDDGAYLGVFLPDRVALTDREALVIVSVLALAPGACDALGPTLGEALLRITLPCPSDFDDGSGSGTPDGGVTIDDLIYYLDLFARGLPQADLDDGSGTGRIDCGVTVDDLLFFLGAFAVGC